MIRLSIGIFIFGTKLNNEVAKSIFLFSFFKSYSLIGIISNDTTVINDHIPTAISPHQFFSIVKKVLIIKF